MSNINQPRPTSKWGPRLSFVAMVCSTPVVAAIAITFVGKAAGLDNDDNFLVYQGLVVLAGTVLAMLVCVPALILGVAGLCLQRSAFSWIAMLFSLVPAALMAVETYTFRQYLASEKELEEQTRLVSITYGYDELTRNSDGSIQRVGGGGKGGSVRLEESGHVRLRDPEWSPPKDGGFHWVALRVEDGLVTLRIYFPNESTSETQLVFGDERQEIWDPTNQHGLRIAIDDLDGMRASTHRLLAQATQDNRDAVEVLVRALSSDDSDVGWDAARQLKKTGQGEAAVPVLVNRLKDPQARVRGATAKQVMEIGPTAKATIPTLIELLNDKDNSVRFQAALALAAMRTEARVAAPALRQLRDAEKGNARNTFDWVLECIGTVDEAEIPKLIETLKSEEARLRETYSPTP